MCSGQTDLTAQLSDEILCHIFSYLTFKDKLHSEAVNIKFQRCIIEELQAKPVHLKIVSERNLNGCRMMPHQLLEALMSFAKKAKFSTVEVLNHSVGVRARKQWLDNLLSLLISESQCLTKLKTFSMNSGCTQHILQNFVDKCEKLSIIKLNFNTPPITPIGPFDIDDWISVNALDFGQLLKNRALTELVLCPYGYHKQGVVELFTGMKPNSLKMVDLWLQQLPHAFSVPRLIQAIASNAGSTLTELNLDFMVSVELADLFHPLSRLIVLRKCAIVCCLQRGLNQQFVSGATSLFKLSNVALTIGFREMDHIHVPNPPACQVIGLIRQIQVIHQQLKIHFDWDGMRLILSVGNASISVVCMDGDNIPKCQQAENCLLCKSFYPSVLLFIRDKAHFASFNPGFETQAFRDWRLDRCMFDQFVENLRTISRFNELMSAEMSSDQQVVTMHFRAQILDENYFTISISCGLCISHGCMKCR